MTEKEKEQLAKAQKEAKTEGFYHKNTVEITLNGKKHRVNKFEAKALEAKLAKNKAKK